MSPVARTTDPEHPGQSKNSRKSQIATLRTTKLVHVAVAIGLAVSLLAIGFWALHANTSPDVLRSTIGDYSADPVAGEPGRHHDYFGLFGIPLDFQVYYRAGEAFAQGVDIYSMGFPVENQGVRVPLPFTYPPIAGVLAQLLAKFPLNVAAVLWQVSSLGVLALVVMALLRRLGMRFGLVLTALAGMIVLASFALVPVRSSFYWGQINVFIMALVVLDFWRSRSPVRAPRRGAEEGTTELDEAQPFSWDPWYSGMGVGIAAALKVYPAFFGLLFLLQRRWRAAAVSAVTFIGMQLLGVAFAPTISWTYWTDIMWQTDRFDGIANVTSQSFKTVLEREYGEDTTLVWLVLVAFAVALCIYIARAALRRGDVIVPASVFGLTACLISPFSWHHYYLWLLPLAIAACGAGVTLFLRVVHTWLAHSASKRSKESAGEYESQGANGAEVFGIAVLGLVCGLALPLVIFAGMWPYWDNVLSTRMNLYVLVESDNRLLHFAWVLWMLVILAGIAVVEAVVGRRRRPVEDSAATKG